MRELAMLCIFGERSFDKHHLKSVGCHPRNPLSAESDMCVGAQTNARRGGSMSTEFRQAIGEELASLSGCDREISAPLKTNCGIIRRVRHFCDMASLRP